MIKGVVLAGGLGTRLAPLTQNDNKHLLPVYNRRMIEYPIQTLTDAGIKEIILITGGQRPGAFLELFKNGKQHHIERLFYTYQEGNGGIADALKLAQPFVDEDCDDCIVILGDNYFEDGVKDFVNSWWTTDGGAKCLLKQTNTPWHFGIAEVANNKIISIEEKPSEPKSDMAILGCYLFDNAVWYYLDTIQPSNRGELEITDLLRQYMEADELTYSSYSGYWSDMGTFETWSEVSQRIATRR